MPPRKVIPDGVVVMGSPAKVGREVTDKDRLMLTQTALHYQQHSQRYRMELKVETK